MPDKLSGWERHMENSEARRQDPNDRIFSGRKRELMVQHQLRVLRVRKKSWFSQSEDMQHGKKVKMRLKRRGKEEMSGKRRILEMFQHHYASICHLFVTRWNRRVAHLKPLKEDGARSKKQKNSILR